MATHDPTILSGNVIVIRKRYCTVAVLLIGFTCIFLQAAVRMETGANLRAYISPALSKLTETKASLKYRTPVASSMNGKTSSTLHQSSTTKGYSKKLPTTDISTTNINRNKGDKHKLENVGDKSRKIVLIVAYMRTGSTLTGSIYQEYPDAFYVFEPFRLLHQAFKEPNSQNNVELEYMNGTERIYSASDKMKAVLDELNGWLDCNLDSISTLSLKGGLNKHFIKYTDMFDNCDKDYISESCLKKGIRSCIKSPLLALKVIRLRMREVAKLLPSYPNMKVIHLVRDPRGMFNSRINSEAVATNNYKATVENHCFKVEEDLKYSKKILQKYPDKLKILHYEDLAENPLETARALIEFVGLDFVKSVKDHIEGQTNAAQDAGKFATQRKNSTETANRWRVDIDPEIAQYIYKTCKISNTALGYLPLESVRTLRNQMIPSRKSS